MISRREAKAQGLALSAAAKHSPVGPIRARLQKESREWWRAGEDYDAAAGAPPEEARLETAEELRSWATSHIADGLALDQSPEELAAKLVDRFRPDLDEEPDGPEIVFVGICGPGMMAYAGTLDEEDWLPIVRVLHQHGQTSLHLEGARGRDVYRNYLGPLSPVVVKK